ncbi:hypothetical protein LCGC14_1947530 [marine sediment metagenome]|uniref:Primosomal protein n=1 Tax=marine sediment metagenome TaxID=412755 RepID=A0A0F9FIP5_9ZZZZ
MTEQILTDFTYLTYDRQMITEALGRGGPLILKNVVLQTANQKNQNGRIYPMPILMREAERYKQFITERRALGELDHPESPVVNLKNVSHNLTELWFNGENLMGNIEVLGTPSGNILKELLKNNIKLGISSRGLGSIKELDDETVEVQEDFSLICFDVVSNPSTEGAFINESVLPGAKCGAWCRVNSLVYDFMSEVTRK